jgi:glycosyltransferase involved in cell wall biosynthesis
MKGRIVIFGWAQSVHVRRWVEGLAQRGYQLKVISLGGEPLPGVETCLLPRRGKWSYLTQTNRAIREARAFRPDIAHAHYAAGFGLWTLRVNFAPTIVSVWGSDIIDFPSNRLSRNLIKKVLGRATHITATGELLKRTALRLNPDAAGKITVIPFGVTVPDDIAPLPPPPVRLCFIKQHRPKYGPDILLRALAEVKKSVPDITLSMAGDGEMTASLKRLATELQLTQNVSFVGFIPNERMYSFLRRHHIMVMPSLVEGFGVASLEAAACGRPVIASNVGGVPEVVQDGRTGILVPPGDHRRLAEAIVKLSGDAQLCRQMGQAGHRFVKENYSWEKSLDMMCSLYDKLIHERAAG